ncbi:MAG: glycosyltransferase [Pseudomonadota bacterium]
MKKVKISIIIPAFCKQETLRRCLNAIIMQNYEQKSLEIIIVDDKSDDNLKKEANTFKNSFFGKIKYLRNNINQGRAITKNIGAKNASHDILFFLDVDMAINKSCISNIVREYNFEKNIVLILKIKADKLQGETSAFANNLNKTYYKDNLFKHNEEIKAGNLGGAFLINKTLFNKVSGFDEAFVKYGAEDFDLGIRLKQNQAKLIYTTKSIALIYDENLNFKSRLSKIHESSQYSMPIILKKHPHIFFSESSSKIMRILEKKDNSTLFNLIIKNLLDTKLSNFITKLIIATDKSKIQIPLILYKYVFASAYKKGIKKRKPIIDNFQFYKSRDTTLNLFGFHTYKCFQNYSDNINIRRHTKLKTSILELRDCIIDTNKIKVSRGEEKVEDVLGRSEELELPSYDKSALILKDNLTINKNIHEYLHNYQKDIIAALSPSPDAFNNHDMCFKEPVFMLTRYEYCNLYHGIIEIYNAFVASLLYPFKKKILVFLDGHAIGKLDEIWTKLFDEVYYIKHMQAEKILFKKIILVNPGYQSPLNKYEMLEQVNFCPDETFLRLFTSTLLEKYKINKTPKKDKNKKRLLLLFRVDYLPHPRSDGITDRKIQDPILELKKLKLLYPDYICEKVAFEHLSIGEQFKIIHNTDLLISVHGAANAHVLFLKPGSKFIEYFTPKTKEIKMFEYFSKLNGIEYEKKLCKKVKLVNGKELVERLISF